MKFFIFLSLTFSLLLSITPSWSADTLSSAFEKDQKLSPKKTAAPKEFKTIYLKGPAKNVTSNQPGLLSMQITAKKGELTAKGVYDSLHLFGRFEVPGKILPHCAGERAICMQFEGDLLLGDDGSGFPSGTRARYVMSLTLNPEGVDGTYRIGGLDSFFDYDQYGILTLNDVGSPDPVLKKMKISGK